VHEQENAKVKGKGGVIGLTENPTALYRWLTCGPDLARIVNEFESQFIPDEFSDVNPHHTEGHASQKQFQEQTSNLVRVISSYGNPFQDDCPELLILNSRNCSYHRTFRKD